MNFVNLHEADVRGLVDLALRLKKDPPRDKPLAGKQVGLVFMNPSLRTQTSFAVACHMLGADPVVLHSNWKLEAREGVVMDGEAAEHAKEAVRVLSRYVDLLGVRCFEDEAVLQAFVKYASVPVVSLESAMGHPCQALADMMTIREHRPRAKRFLLTWAPHVKPLPMAVPHSAAEMASLAGMEVVIARPKGYDLRPEVMARLKNVTVTEDVEAAYEGADVVYAKAWGKPQGLAQWRVTKDKMARTNDAIFMHCLPVRRNVVVDDDVIDDKRSVVIDQAENRLHTAKAVLLSLLDR